MKASLDTSYRQLDQHGSSVACLKFTLETPDAAFRDSVAMAIRKAMAPPEQDKEEKQSAIGFSHAE